MSSVSVPSVSKWQAAIAALSLAAIGGHFLLIESPLKDYPLLGIIILGGVPLVMQILIKLLRGSIGADMLGAIGLAAAALLGQYLVATLIVLMLASGQALEAYAARRASAVLLALAERMPARAHRKTGEHIEDIAIKDITVGDRIAVYPHESCPVDGTVIEGHGSMDESYLTGEPYQISKAPGASVLSGAINGASALVIRAEKAPEDSRYATIMRVMEDAEQKRPALRRLGDQLGGVFALAALLLSGAVWFISHDTLRALAVLVIATPCPLLIAIPVTIISTISLAARRGIIIKDPAVLERLPTCRTAIFDKTGTLTYGRPELVDVVTFADFSRDSVLKVIASLERYSKHPLASAIIKAAEQSGLALLEAQRVSETPGQGLTGYIENKEIHITHRKKLAISHPELLPQLPPMQPGMECVALADGQLMAVLFFRDTPRKEGYSFITHLSPSHGFAKIMLVSGDRASEVEYLASLLGIKETHASQSPEQKLTLVREETAKAPTLFMGDGINDAPALAAATVGLAFGQISVTAEAAGAVIMDSTLAKVDELLHISRSMRSIAMQSAVGGILLSVIGMGLAAVGYITPVIGALLQEAIDVLAIVNALRLTWRPKIEADIRG